MNYSYLMGIGNIDILKQNDFKIKYFGNNYGVIFDDNKIELFEKYISETLENGFWNEYIGKDKFEYALEFIPSKVPIYPEAIKYEYSHKELEMANKFALMNGNYYRIQRIDFIKLEDNTLLLTEIEDISPYLNLDQIDEKTREKFIIDYKNMVYEYMESKGFNV